MKLTNISVIRDLMDSHGFSFTKSLGQNFLINPSVCPRMAEMSKIAGNSDTVIEIGAGIGVLTCELSKVYKKVIVIEIDEKLSPILAQTLSDCDNVSIIWGDALKVDLNAIIAESVSEGGTVSVVANLPYYAATHIIMSLLERQDLPIDSLTVMVQKEVAQRFTASPKTKQYGIVSVAARFYSQPKMLFGVSRGSFMPAPNVDSAVIRLDRIPPRLSSRSQTEQFFRLVRAAFSERRKQLVNPVSKEFAIDKETVGSLLKSPTLRAEDLSVEEFVELYENLSSRNLL